MDEKFPSFSQWKQLFKVLQGLERTIFLVLVVLTILSGGYLAVNFYIKNTKSAPAYGGIYIEGVVGQPRFINPIYGDTNDVDRTLIGLIYSGLMNYDKDGKIVNDLVKNYQISENGTLYTFELKDNLFWQDGQPLTADDIVYTIETIQDSDYKSPLRANWLNVDIKKISDKSFSFSLNTPYNSFLENCIVKIIPQHKWKNVLPENFALSPYNLQPIGSGPYVISKIQEAENSFIKNITLEVNKKYYEKLPYISKISFNFFGNNKDLMSAVNQKTVNGFSTSDIADSESSVEKQVKQGWTASETFIDYSFSLPRYFAVFFNTQSSKIFSDVNINQALSYSVNKPELIQKINEQFKEKISAVNSPILPDYFGYSAPTTTYDFNTDVAVKLFEKTGYKDLGNGIREKINNKKPAFQFKSYLKVGSKSDEVAELQKCLAKLDDAFATLMQNETNGKYGQGTLDAVTAFQKKYLPDVASTGETGPGTRKKLNELCAPSQNTSTPLQFTLTTINQSQLVVVANLLKDYWQNVGVKIELKIVEASELKNIIKDRSYDALLYGQALGSLPDLYPFWHSTQINDPGINICEYQNKKADPLLKEARETLNEQIKSDDYAKLQNIILADAPAIFLYNPNYSYWVSKKIQGIDTTKIVDPAKRFQNITNWYIKTKRVWK